MPSAIWQKWFGLPPEQEAKKIPSEDLWRGVILILFVFLVLLACGWTATLGIAPPKPVNIRSNIPVDYSAEELPISQPISVTVLLGEISEDEPLPEQPAVTGTVWPTPEPSLTLSEATATAISLLFPTSTPKPSDTLPPPLPTATPRQATTQPPPASPPTFTETPPPPSTQTPTATPTSTQTPTQTATRVILPPTSTPTATQAPPPSHTPTFTATPSRTPTPSQTLTPTLTRTSTLTPTPSRTPTPSQTPTLTFTASQTPTSTPTSTITPTPTASPTSTRTFTPSPTPIITIPPPPLGDPDGIAVEIPCFTGTILDLGTSTSDSTLVYYEIIGSPPNTDHIFLDWVSVWVNNTGTDPWNLVFFWGDGVLDNNGSIPESYATDADGENDNEFIPTDILYGTPPYQTGILIPIPAAFRPYRYVLISAPPSCGDPAEVDAIRTLP